MSQFLYKTVKPAGGDYTSLEACMNANEQDLTGDGWFDVEIDGIWSSADTTPVSIDTYVTTISDYINIYTTNTARHDGTFGGSNFYKLSHSSWDTSHIKIFVHFVTINGLAIDGSSGGYRGGGIQGAYEACKGLTIKNCILKGMGGDEAGWAIYSGYNTDLTYPSYFYNNIIYEDRPANNNAWGIHLYGRNMYCYNNTVYGNLIGIYFFEDNGTICIKNNNCIGNGTDFSGTSSDAGYNLSSDDTAPGANSKKSSTLDPDASVSTECISTSDLHLISTANAINSGLDLSTTFTDDIDGETRPTGAGTWDIGADEYIELYPASLEWGEQNPSQGETAKKWSVWDDGAATPSTILGDPDWGKIYLDTSSIGHGSVENIGTTGVNRIFTITQNRYGTGVGSFVVKIRGSDTIFAQDDVNPSWETYTVPIGRQWAYVQVRLEGG